MRGMTRDSLAELFDRKILWVFAVLTVFAMLGAAASRSLNVRLKTSGADWQTVKGEVMLTAMKSLDAFVALLVFLAVMASASAVPHMLEKGRADYFLSKPISRKSLLLSKISSTWVVYSAVVVLAGLLVFGTISLIHELFDLRVFWLLCTAAVSLLVWFSITFAAGIFSGSTAMAIIAAFMTWIAQTVLAGREGLKMFFSSDIADAIVDGLYYIFPKMSELSDLGLALALGEFVDNWLPLWSSLLFGVGVMTVALVYFVRKDY